MKTKSVKEANLKECIKAILTIILLLAFSTAALGQKLEPKERIIQPDHTVYFNV
ncbi:MAG: hypothetical protein ACI8XG_000213 [Congregibacter sp.]